MDFTDEEMEAEYHLMTAFAEKRWVLIKKLKVLEEQISKNSNYWYVGKDGLVALF